jgi:hypothetical protein
LIYVECFVNSSAHPRLAAVTVGALVALANPAHAQLEVFHRRNEVTLATRYQDVHTRTVTTASGDPGDPDLSGAQQTFDRNVPDSVAYSVAEARSDFGPTNVSYGSSGARSAVSATTHDPAAFRQDVRSTATVRQTSYWEFISPTDVSLSALITYIAIDGSLTTANYCCSNPGQDLFAAIEAQIIIQPMVLDGAQLVSTPGRTEAAMAAVLSDRFTGVYTSYTELPDGTFYSQEYADLSGLVTVHDDGFRTLRAEFPEGASRHFSSFMAPATPGSNRFIHRLDLITSTDAFAAYPAEWIAEAQFMNTSTFGFVLPEGMTVRPLSVTADERLMPAGVPEPATWAVMILGFGVTGAMLRRRSQRSIPARSTELARSC